MSVLCRGAASFNNFEKDEKSFKTPSLPTSFLCWKSLLFRFLFGAALVDFLASASSRIASPWWCYWLLMFDRINRFSFAVFEQLFQVFQEFNHNPCCWLDAIQKLYCSLTKVLELDYSSFLASHAANFWNNNMETKVLYLIIKSRWLFNQLNEY